jgi:hypothetical protein
MDISSSIRIMTTAILDVKYMNACKANLNLKVNHEFSHLRLFADEVINFMKNRAFVSFSPNQIKEFYVSAL